MNTLLTSYRCCSRLHRLALLVLAALLGSVSLSRANDFTLSTHTLSFSEASQSLAVRVTALSSTPVLVQAYASGSPFSVTPSSHWVPDSTGSTYFDFYGHYAGSSDTASGCIVFYTANQVDTVFVTGYDTSYHASQDFYVPRTSLTVRLESDSAIWSMPIQNAVSLVDTVYAQLEGSTAWSFQYSHSRSTMLILSARQQTSFPLLYTKTHNPYDTALLILTSHYPIEQVDTVVLYGENPLYNQSSVHLGIPYINLGNVGYGDTVCRLTTVVNLGDEITLDSILIHGSPTGWAVNDPPTLPVTLAPGDSVSFNVCYTAVDYGQNSYAQLEFVYHDSTLHNGRTSSYAYATPPSCLEPFMDSIQMHDAMVGGYAEATVTYTNHSTTDSLFDVSFTSSPSWVTCTTSLPVLIPTGGSTDITFRVTPTFTLSRWYATAYIRGVHDSTCDTRTMLYGRADSTTADSLGLFSGETEVLGLRTAASTTTRTFTFRNNSGHTVHVNSIWLASGTHFAITGVSPHAAPDTLQSGEELSIDVQFNGDTVGFYQDSLLMDIESGLLPYVFSIQAVRDRPAAVRSTTQPQFASLIVTPNPTSGPLHIEVAGAVDVEQIALYDLLGHRLESSAHSTTWTTNVPSDISGVYFIRAEGFDTTGHPFVLTRRVVLR